MWAKSFKKWTSGFWKEIDFLYLVYVKEVKNRNLSRAPPRQSTGVFLIFPQVIIEGNEHFREKRAIVKIQSQLTQSREYTWTYSSFECRAFCWKTTCLPWKFGACLYSKNCFYWKANFLSLNWGAFLNVFAHVVF